MSNSILDAFNAAAAFSQQWFGHQTNKFRERNDKQLKLNHDIAQTNIQNWIRDNPYKGGANKQEDEQLYKLYQIKLDEYVNAQYNAAGVLNNSKYYQENLSYIRDQALESSRNYSLQSQDAWRRDQDNETLRSTNRRIQTDAENWRRDNPFKGGASKEEDEELYKIYQQKQNTFINELIDNELMGEHSQYYRESLEKSRGQFHEEYRDISLQSQDAWRREQDNIDLKNTAILIQSKIENHTRDKPYVIGKNEEEDEKTYYGYMEDLTYLIDEQIAEAKKRNNSEYYLMMLDQMGESIILATEDYVLGKHDEFRINREFINLDNDIKEIMSTGLSSGWDMQTILDAVDNRISLAGTKVELNPRSRYEIYNRAAVEIANLNLTKKITDIDNSGLNIQDSLAAKMTALEEYNKLNLMTPAQEYKYKSDFFNSALDQALGSFDFSNMTVFQAMNILDGIMPALETAAAPFLSAGESIDNYLSNKQERLSGARQAARMTIWKRNYNIGEAMDNEFRRIAADAVRLGDFNLLREAQRLWYEISEYREMALANIGTEYSDFNFDDASKIESWGPIVNGLFEKKESTTVSSASENLKRTLQEMRDYHVRGIAEGRSDFEEGRTAFINNCGIIASEHGMTINELERQYSSDMKISDMWEDVKKIIIKNDPGYGLLEDNIKTYLDGWADEKNITIEEKALRQRQGQLIGMLAFDMIMDTFGTARPSPDQLQRRILNIASQLVAGDIAFTKLTVDNSNRYEGGTNDNRFGKAIYEISQHPWARFKTQGAAYTFGDTQYMQDLENQALDKFETITGIPLANLNINGHAKEGMYDETAEFTIQVIGRGSENGTFKFAADANGTYWIEKQTNNGWERDNRYNFTSSTVQRDANWQTMEQHGKIQRASEQQSILNNWNDIFNQISNETDSYRKQALVQYVQMPGDLSIPTNEFWKRGVSPTTGNTVTEIPARVWDNILSSLTSAEQTVQRNKWQAMGITRGR